MKRNVYIMYIISLLQGMVFYAPIATLYRTAQGLSVFQITITESLFFILCLSMEIPWGIIADKIGYKKTMIFCCSLYFVSKVVFWQATGFIWFLLERVILGIVFAGLSGVDSSILYLSCEKEESQKTFGFYNALGTVGLLVASVVYSIFIGNNYKLAGFLTVISYALAMFLSIFLKEVKTKEKYENSIEETKAIFTDILKNKSLLFLLVSIALLTETQHMFTVFLNQIQYEKCGVSNSIIGYIYTVATIIGLCSVFSAGLTKRQGSLKFGNSLFLISGITSLVLAFTKNGGISIGSILLLQAASSLFQPLQLELQNKQIKTKNRATALSVNAILIDCISVGVSLFYGYLTGINLTYAFIAGFVFCVFGVLIFKRCLKKLEV